MSISMKLLEGSPQELLCFPKLQCGMTQCILTVVKKIDLWINLCFQGGAKHTRANPSNLSATAVINAPSL